MIKKQKLKKDVRLPYGWWGMTKWADIPAGTLIIPATNLSGDKRRCFWLNEIPKDYKDNEEFKSWYRNYGFLIYPEDLL